MVQVLMCGSNLGSMYPGMEILKMKDLKVHSLGEWNVVFISTLACLSLTMSKLFYKYLF